jgi:CO/xanthine dehydrogenase Mo-binding subunit
MANYTTIGMSVAQVEGPNKVTGQTKYPADIILPGTLWGKALRSPLPHARIVHIDTSKAKLIPGVHAIITANDIPDTRIGRRLLDLPVLARDKVRFIGEKVVGIAAEDPDIIDEAIDLIDIEYEELPAVFDPLEALRPDAPIIHNEINKYEGLPELVKEPTNLFSQVVLSKGNLEQGFAESDKIFEHTFTVPWVHQAYMEPHACMVHIDDSGKIQVWANNKAPFLLRDQLAKCILVKPDQICVNVTNIGGDFGGKGSSMDVPLCYFLAKDSGLPVKMVMNYMDEFIAGNPRHPAKITIRTGVKNDGTLVALKGRAIFNSGAYGAFKPSPTVNLPGAVALAGSYRIPNVSIVAECVYTNTIPCGHMRSPGGPQTNFAVESHMDIIANELGLDPLEFRIRNVLQEGDSVVSGLSFKQVKGEETLRRAAEAAGWGQSKPSPLIGRGIAIYDRKTGGGQGNGAIIINPDGTATLLSSTFDQGSGTPTILRQIVAEELTLPLADIQIVTLDTDSGPFDGGVGGSRVTHMAGQAILKASESIRDTLIGLAANLLNCEKDSVHLQNAHFLSDRDETRRISIREVAKEGIKLFGKIEARTIYTPKESDETTSFCAQVAEVEVDKETGQIKLRHFVSVNDIGTVLNPMALHGQIEGGIAMGLGYALMEELKIEDGQVVTAHFGDYKIPTMQDMPRLTTILLEDPTGPTPYKGKGIGETPNCPTAPAIANAVADAVGVRIMDLPITAEKVFQALRAQGKS